MPVAIIQNTNSFTSVTGRFLSEMTAAEASNYLSNFKTLTTMLEAATGKLVHKTTPSDAMTLLCSKPNNPYDLPGPLQNLWLRTTDKIVKTIPEITKWGSLISKLVHSASSASTSSASTSPSSA